MVGSGEGPRAKGIRVKGQKGKRAKGQKGKRAKTGRGLFGLSKAKKEERAIRCNHNMQPREQKHIVGTRARTLSPIYQSQ